MSVAQEARRQAALLAALQGPHAALPPGAQGLPGPTGQGGVLAGVQAYRANALATACRALSAAHPTLVALLGDEAMQALARDLWWQCPPSRGDLAHWGADLPALIQGIDAYGDVPYLADVARLDWAVHQAASAADSADAVAGLERLADTDPDTLVAEFSPGAALVPSAYPIVSLWQAHRDDGEGAGADEEPGDRPVAQPAWVRAAQALREQGQECAWIWRVGWGVQVDRLAPADARFTACLLAGGSLARALQASEPPEDHGGSAGPDPEPAFAFDTWLVRALRAGWLRSWRNTAA